MMPLGIVAAALSSLLLCRDSDALDRADRAAALGWLRTHPALQDIYFQLVGLICARGMLWMQEMEPFRRDPRFRRVIARLGFAEYWQRHGSPEMPLAG